MEKVILTGSKGFIGSNLKVELEKQFEVIEINEDVQIVLAAIITKSRAPIYNNSYDIPTIIFILIFTR